MRQNHSRLNHTLVDPAWLATRADDPNVCLIEVAGMWPEGGEALIDLETVRVYDGSWAESRNLVDVPVEH